MYSCSDTHILIWVRSRIRISTALRLFATPRGFSQLVTSFFGAWCQGILRTLFFRLVIRVSSTRLPSGNKKTFVSVLVLFLLARHLLRYFLLYSTISHVLCSMLLTRSRFSSTSRFNVYFLFSLCSCQCTNDANLFQTPKGVKKA